MTLCSLCFQLPSLLAPHPLTRAPCVSICGGRTPKSGLVGPEEAANAPGAAGAGAVAGARGVGLHLSPGRGRRGGVRLSIGMGEVWGGGGRVRGVEGGGGGGMR